MHRLIVFAFWLCLLASPSPFLTRVVADLAEATIDPTETDMTHLLEPGRHRITLQIDGWNRKLVFVAPTGIKPGEQLPLVFFFHGAGGTADGAARMYGWAEKAESEHFFAAFPEGLGVRPGEEASFLLNPHIWRDGRPVIQSRGVDDIHFFTTLLDQLESALPIDKRRIYVTGFSNGAGMTFTLGAQFPNRIAAIAPVSSETFVSVTALTRPLPVYYLTGTADPLVPFQGGESKRLWGAARTLPPVQDSVDTWVKLDGCPPEPQVVSDENGVRVIRYGPGNGGVEILFTTIEGNGHHWPGTIERLPHAIVGPCLDPFHATDRIWDFFKTHPLP
jgi:polyhydroxybutyrate depolymerase